MGRGVARPELDGASELAVRALPLVFVRQDGGERRMALRQLAIKLQRLERVDLCLGADLVASSSPVVADYGVAVGQPGMRQRVSRVGRKGALEGGERPARERRVGASARR
jgi:hypothetical protein